MITGINHITLSVHDINEAFTFYKNILGFQPIMKSSFSAYFSAGNIWIALLQEEFKPKESERYSHICLNINKNDFNEQCNILKENGVKEWKRNNTEGESFYFLDPSKNKLEIHSSSLQTRIDYGKKNWDNTVEWFV